MTLTEFHTFVAAKEVSGQFHRSTIHVSPITEGKYIVYVWGQYNEGYWYAQEDKR